MNYKEINAKMRAAARHGPSWFNLLPKKAKVGTVIRVRLPDDFKIADTVKFDDT